MELMFYFPVFIFMSSNLGFDLTCVSCSRRVHLLGRLPVSAAALQRRPAQDHPAGPDLHGREGEPAPRRRDHVAVQLQVQPDGGHVRRGQHRPAAELRHSVRQARARRHRPGRLRRDDAHVRPRPHGGSQVAQLPLRIRLWLSHPPPDQPGMLPS